MLDRKGYIHSHGVRNGGQLPSTKPSLTSRKGTPRFWGGPSGRVLRDRPEDTMSSPHWNHIPRVNMYVLQGENLRFKSTVITCVTTVSKLHVSWKWPGLHDGPCYDWFAYALWNMSRCVGTATKQFWHIMAFSDNSVGAYSSGLLYWQWLEQACISCVPLFITSRHPHNDGLVQERRNSNALAMEVRLSCTNPLIYEWIQFMMLCYFGKKSDHGSNLRWQTQWHIDSW